LVEDDTLEKSYESAFELSGKAVENLPEVINQLEIQSTPYLKKMQHILPKKVVASFAQMLIDLGRKFDNKPVEDYGNEILNASKAFNVEKEKMLIKQFDSFVEKLKELLP